MFMEKTRLRFASNHFATNHYRAELIKRLLKAGHTVSGGRNINELSLSELVKEWQIVKVRGIDKMNLLVSHFMNEYELSREQAEALLNESLTDFDVMRTILKAADRRVIVQ